jgi:hypothetical protein
MHEQVGAHAPDLAFTLSAAWLAGPSRLPAMEAHLRAVANDIGHPAAFSLLESADLSSQEASALTQTLDAAVSGSR